MSLYIYRDSLSLYIYIYMYQKVAPPPAAGALGSKRADGQSKGKGMGEIVGGGLILNRWASESERRQWGSLYSRTGRER